MIQTIQRWILTITTQVSKHPIEMISFYFVFITCLNYSLWNQMNFTTLFSLEPIKPTPNSFFYYGEEKKIAPVATTNEESHMVVPIYFNASKPSKRDLPSFLSTIQKDIHINDLSYQTLCQENNDSCEIFLSKNTMQYFSKDKPGNGYHYVQSQSKDIYEIYLLFSLPNPHQTQLVQQWVQALKEYPFQHFEQISFDFPNEIQDTGFDFIISRLARLVHKMKELILNTHQSEFLVVLLGYCMSLGTFLNLYIKMKKMGSKITLFLSIIVSGTFAFITSLSLFHFLGYSIDFLLLTEATPFLFVTIGFDKAIKLTNSCLSSLMKSSHQPRLQLQTTQEILDEGIRNISFDILKEYLFEIGLLMIGSTSQIKGLKEFCLLSFILLIFDCFYLFTFYISVLSLKLEILKIRNQSNPPASQSQSNTSPAFYKQITLQALSGSDLSRWKSINNPTVSRIKVVLILGLIAAQLFHFHSKPKLFLNENDIALKLSQPFFSLFLSNFSVKILPPLIFQSAAPGSNDPTFQLRNSYLFIVFSLSLLLNFYYFFKNSNSSVNLQPTITNSSNDLTLANHCSQIGLPKDLPPVEKTESSMTLIEANPNNDIPLKKIQRSVDECYAILMDDNLGPLHLSDLDILRLIENQKLPLYSLEKVLKNHERAVKLRRESLFPKSHSSQLNLYQSLPFEGYQYDRVFGQCCENVIGYLPLPIGIAGPLLIDGKSYLIPMATTEGCLVASTSRGCKALSMSGGVTTRLLKDEMTRGPVIEFQTLAQAFDCKQWIEHNNGLEIIKQAFNSTTKYGKLNQLKVTLVGKLMYLRFQAFTGDAMGMNMISKGCEKSLAVLSSHFPFDIISLSGNYCTDKKPAAINWIEGRGKSITSEAIIPKQIIEKTLKTTVSSLLDLNMKKNLIGSAMAGSIGGFNAHASNILTAVYLATGQDPAQNVESSQCITVMESVNQGQDLYLSCTMPCIEVGTIGGGTTLPAQASCLDMLGVKGAHSTDPGANSRQLAKIICASVMAGELSLCSALAAGHLVKSHMIHNRSQQSAPPK